MSNNSNYVVKKYPLDLAQKLESNKVINEEHELDSNDFPVVIPLEGSFFSTSVKVSLDGKLLKYGMDYQLAAFNYEASEKAAKSIYDSIVFRKNLKGKLSIDYWVIGEPWVNRVSQIQRLYNLYLGEDRPVNWDRITNKPDGFPCIDHHHYGWDIRDWGALTIAVIQNTEALVKLHVSYEARIEQLFNNLKNNFDSSINTIMDLLNQDWGRFRKIEDDIANLTTRLGDLSDEFHEEEWVPETRKINGYTLDNDIVLNNEDVGAISSKYKDTFLKGFNDNLTNIGKVIVDKPVTFNTVNEMVDLPIGYHGFVGRTSVNWVPINAGYMHKVGAIVDSGSGKKVCFFVFYDIWTPRTWHGSLVETDSSVTWRLNGGGTPGEVKVYFGTVPPIDHAFLHGQTFDKTTNPVCASMFPSGILPDARGLFIRGWDNGRGVDCEPHRGMGSYQHDRTQDIWGNINVTLHNTDYIFADGVFYVDSWRGQGDDGTVSALESAKYIFHNARVARTGPEETVKNIAANWMIRLG